MSMGEVVKLLLGLVYWMTIKPSELYSFNALPKEGPKPRLGGSSKDELDPSKISKYGLLE